MKTHHQNIILKQQIFDQFSRIFFDFHIYFSINKKFSKNAHTYMFKNIFQKSRFCQNIANSHTIHDSKNLKILCQKRFIRKILIVVQRSCERLKSHYSTHHFSNFKLIDLRFSQVKNKNKNHKKHFLKISWYTFWLRKKSMWKIKTHEYFFAKSRDSKKKMMSRYKLWQHILFNVNV